MVRFLPCAVGYIADMQTDVNLPVVLEGAVYLLMELERAHASVNLDGEVLYVTSAHQAFGVRDVNVSHLNPDD